MVFGLVLLVVRAGEGGLCRLVLFAEGFGAGDVRVECDEAGGEVVRFGGQFVRVGVGGCAAERAGFAVVQVGALLFEVGDALVVGVFAAVVVCLGAVFA